MKKLFLFIICLLALTSVQAHPGIGIACNSKGEIFYSDLARVWKVSADGKSKTVVIPNVHTHELHMDAQDNLYGEHLWYEGEATDKWGHFVWKYDAHGSFTKVIPNKEGFLSNYSFNRDTAGNMYWIERGKKESLLMKRTNDGTISIEQTLKTVDVRWQHCSKDGTFYYVDDNDLFKVKDGKVSALALNLDDVKGYNLTGSPNHHIFGILTDNANDIYVAVYDKKEIRKIDKNGKVTVTYTSEPSWGPTGGLFDKEGNLWILENNALNQVRVVKINQSDLGKVSADKSGIESFIFNIISLLLTLGFISFLVRKFPVMKSIRLITQALFFICFVSPGAFAQQSGIAVGADAPAFDPYHVSGKDKGTKTCPMCKYGTRTDGLMIWINDDMKNYEPLLLFLEAQYMIKNASQWKTFVIYMNPKREKPEVLKQKLSNYAEKLNLKNVALTFISSPTDAETAGVYQINPVVKNTIFEYKKRVISKKIIDFNINTESFSTLINL